MTAYVFTLDHVADEANIPCLLAGFANVGLQCTFVSQMDNLDIDTPGKDSYALFEAGCDFVMLVTDKQRYLKSQHDLSSRLPTLLDADCVIQTAEIYPETARIRLNDKHLVTACGKTFALDDLSLFLHWLEANNE